MVSTLTGFKYKSDLHTLVHVQRLTLFSLLSFSQSLVQNSRKAGITSAMASTTLGNEELVSFLPLVLFHNSVQHLITPGIKLTFLFSVSFTEEPCL